MGEAEKPLTNEELERMYSEGESCDKEIAAEQRSNILLTSGEHWSKKHSKWASRVRESKSIPNDQKLRITKNHLWKVSRTYINGITSMAPGVTPTPNDPKDLQHVKTAELDKSVWEYAKHKHSLRTKIKQWAKDYVDIGEVFVQVNWEPNAGRFVGYEQETHDETGEPMFDEMGQPVPSKKAVFTGDLMFKRILPANVIRPAEATSIAEAKWLCVREMVGLDELRNLVGDDEEKEKLIVEHQDETFFVFDSNRGNFSKSKNQTLLKTFFFRQSPCYPQGYFVIKTSRGILFEGELPYGIFPLEYEGFDEIATTPRHRSIMKQLRPIQSEINRASSAMAETQVTLGDDKIILQNGSKVTTGPHLPGIRTMFVTGMAPTVMAGRTGDQFLPYAQAQVAELYQVANLNENDADLPPGADALANLYRSIKDQKRFSYYAEKFEGFLGRVCALYLDLARNYFDENMLIPAIGKSEHINISEFKNNDPLCTRIKVEAQAEDINEMMGRHLVYNHILQYASSSLGKDDIGRIIRDMPFANHEDAFEDFTLDHDTAVNVMLALDRGEQVQPNKTDNAEYLLKRLGSRQKKADYRLLAPQIQMAYDQLIAQYEQIKAQQAADLKAAESQFIPSGGAMIKADFYVPDPSNPARSIRATLPAEAVDWLVKQLAAQGSAQEQLMQLPPAIQNDLTQMIAHQGQPQRQLTPPPQMAMPMPMQNQFPRG